MNIVSAITRKPFQLGLLLLLLALLAALPHYAPGYPPVLLSDILMYVILAVAWTIFSGPTGYISLTPAAFLGVGIYASAILGKELPLAAVIVIGGLASFCLALLVGALTLRLRGIYFSIFTFGLVMLIAELVRFWEINVTRTRGRFVIPESTNTVYYTILAIFLATMLAAYLIRRSKYGLALRSIGENEEAAAHMGVNVTMVKVVTFAISAIFMAAAGAIMATRWTYIDVSIAFNPNYSFMPVLMAIFGGTGQLFGPVVGAAVFAYLEEFLITRLPELYMVIFGLILVIAILYLPTGLAGLLQNLWKRISGGQRATT